MWTLAGVCKRMDLCVCVTDRPILKIAAWFFIISQCVVSCADRYGLCRFCSCVRLACSPASAWLSLDHYHCVCARVYVCAQRYKIEFSHEDSSFALYLNHPLTWTWHSAGAPDAPDLLSPSHCAMTRTNCTRRLLGF